MHEVGPIGEEPGAGIDAQKCRNADAIEQRDQVRAHRAAEAREDLGRGEGDFVRLAPTTGALIGTQGVQRLLQARRDADDHESGTGVITRIVPARRSV